MLSFEELQKLFKKDDEDKVIEEQDNLQRMIGGNSLVSDPRLDDLNERLSTPKSNLSYQELLDRYNQVKQPQQNPIKKDVEKAPVLEPLPKQNSQQDNSFSNNFNIDKFKDAEDLAQKELLVNNIFRGMSKIGASIARVNPDLTNYENNEKQILDKRNRINREQEFKSRNIDLQNKEDFSNPSSKVSLLAQDFAGKMGLDPEKVKNLSYNQLKEIMGESRAFKQFEESIAARKEVANLTRADQQLRREEMQNRFDTNLVEKYQTKAQQATKDAREALEGSKNLVSLVEQSQNGNPMALASIGVMAAKARGERGALSESDVTRYVQNPSISGKVADYINKAAEGKVSKETGEFLKEVERVLQGRIKQQLETAYTRYADNFAQNTKSDRKKALEIIVPEIDRQDLFQTNRSVDQVVNETVKVQAPDGSIRTIPKNKLDAAIKAGGKLLE